MLGRIVLSWLVLAAAAANAQAPAPTEPLSTGTVASPMESLQQQLTDLELRTTTATDLDDATSKQVASAIQQARQNLKQAQDYAAQEVTFLERAKSTDAERKQLETSIATLKETPDPKPLPTDTLPDLETKLALAQRTLSELKTRQEQVIAAPRDRAVRRRTLREALLAQPQQLADVINQLQLLPQQMPVTGMSPLLSEAQLRELQARRMALEKLPAAVQSELVYYDSDESLDLPRLRREELALQIVLQEKAVKAFTEEIGRLRREDAEERLKEARKGEQTATAALRPVYSETRRIAEDELRIRQLRQQVQAELDTAEGLRADLQKILTQAQDRDRRIGQTTAVGLRLRQQRDHLPDVRVIRRNLQAREDDIEDAQVAYLDREEQLTDLATPEPLVDALLSADVAALDPLERNELRRDALRAFDEQQQYLASLVDAYRNYTDTLFAVDSAERQLVQDVENFTRFVDERILWIRSHKPLSRDVLAADKVALLWLLDARLWRESLSALGDDVVVAWTWYVLAILALALLIKAGPRLRMQLAHLSRLAENRVNCDFWPTLRALWLTAWLSVSRPGLMMFLAWRLIAATQASDSVHEFGRVLLQAGLAYLLIEFSRQMCRTSGVTASHFGWSPRTTETIRRELTRLIYAALPLMILVAVLRARDTDRGSDAIERLVYIAALGVVAVITQRLMRPGKGVLREWTSYHPGGWIERTQHLWYVLATAVPVLLMVLTGIGYYYTVGSLTEKFHISLWLLLAVQLARGLSFRWLLLRRRRLSITQARQRRAAVESGAALDSTAAAIPEVSDYHADLSAISLQSQRLVHTTLLVASLAGVWFIWVDVLPALNYLDKWPLWQTQETVVEQEPATTGDAPQFRTVTRPRDITVADLTWAGLLLVLVVTAARNVPGLLEIVLLQRLPLDASVRYAIRSVTQYAIVFVGVIVTSDALGIGWAQVQWLAAALTFGLGFGLQEIFANFISGLIILFERPVRVGDVVTIDGVSGEVSRIRMRSTTITDWDRKEYIVPNKEFITGKLMNWTLTDRSLRLTVNVGVAYGSDTERVRQIILRLAAEHPAILDDPPPVVTFESFGDSALNFVLRAYLPNLDLRLATVHDLHTAIHRELHAAGIEIPFPQRDLHLRTAPASLGAALHGTNGPTKTIAPHAHDS